MVKWLVNSRRLPLIAGVLPRWERNFCLKNGYPLEYLEEKDTEHVRPYRAVTSFDWPSPWKMLNILQRASLVPREATSITHGPCVCHQISRKSVIKTERIIHVHEEKILEVYSNRLSKFSTHSWILIFFSNLSIFFFFLEDFLNTFIGI